MSVLGSLELAVVFGLRHALDIDHVAAVGTLIDRDAKPLSVAAIAARWALGHAMTLIIVGVALVLLGVHLPARFELFAELVVAMALLVLGARRVLSAGTAHHHLGRDAFVVGVLHGLAGSGPLVLLSLATVDSRSYALLYLALASLGTLLGMVSVALVLSVPFHKLGSQRMHRRIELMAGAISIVVGVRLAAQVLG